MRVITLLYHDVAPSSDIQLTGFSTPDANIYKLTVEEFEAHLEAIAKQARLPVALIDKAAGPSLMLTFDDGGKSALSHTAAMLEHRGWHGHFFITTDYIGAATFLSAAEIRELRARGHLIGTHSCSHPPRMSRCSPAQLEHEWRDSRAKLEDILGEPVTVGSIPGGYYGDNVVQAAAEAGLRHLFTSEPVTAVKELFGCSVVGRFGIKQGVPSQTAANLVAGRLWPQLHQRIFWDAKKVLKKLGGNAWLEMRKRVLARYS